MTQYEFQERVEMEVSAEEYSHIEEVYMNSDICKDEFCQLWVKMNRARVKKTKEERKAAEEEQAKREKLWNIVYKHINDCCDKELKFAKDVLSPMEKKLVESVGISLYDVRIDGWTGLTIEDSKTIGSVIYEIKKYLKAI